MSRDALDRYYTPHDGIVTWLLTLHPQILMPDLANLDKTSTVLEPCAGTGRIARCLRAHGLDVITGDYDKEVDVDHHWDFTLAAHTTAPATDWIITNPPYKRATDMVIAARARCARVAMLMRLTWMEPTFERRRIWTRPGQAPQYVHPIHPRPSFDGVGTDSATVAWFVWTPDSRCDGTILLPIVDWHEVDQVPLFHP